MPFRLFDKQKQYEEACDKIELLDSQLNDFKTNVANLEELLEEKREDIESYVRYKLLDQSQ